MNDSGFLHKYFLNHNSKKLVHKWFHYFDIYDRHFSRFRNKSPTILEIGVGEGGSLEMWKSYFGEGSRIIGIDIKESCKQFEDIENGIEIYIGSQDDQNLLNSIFEKYPNIDIVIDDGSHINRHMIASFNLMYHKVNPNGVYLVEDTHCCYWQSHEGGLGIPNSFIEFAKSKIEELNAVHISSINPTEFTVSTNSINIYDSIVVFERRRQAERRLLATGEMFNTLDITEKHILGQVNYERMILQKMRGEDI